MTHANHSLGRLQQFDPRSRAFDVRGLLAWADRTRPRSYRWRCPITLDQGREGACVGYAWAHERAARPVEDPSVTGGDAYRLYRHAQTLDPWPGENYDGTSVLAGAKAAKDRGWLTEYRWAFNLTDALTAISRHGPAVLGVNWHTGMWDTDPAGYIHPTGPVVGGHAILARGVNVPGRYVIFRNSWGPGWGRGGDALITWDNLGKLLADDGECCVPIARPR